MGGESRPQVTLRRGSCGTARGCCGGCTRSTTWMPYHILHDMYDEYDMDALSHTIRHVRWVWRGCIYHTIPYTVLYCMQDLCISLIMRKRKWFYVIYPLQLYYTVLYYTVLYSTHWVLYTFLYAHICNIVYYSGVLYYVMLCYTMLCYYTLHYTTLHCTALH